MNIDCRGVAGVNAIGSVRCESLIYESGTFPSHAMLIPAYLLAFVILMLNNVAEALAKS